MPHLNVRRLAKRFPGATSAAVADASFELQQGEILGLLGPSGCGKTTTLRMIAGFEAPDAGEVILDGADITQVPVERRQIGFVFQDYALFPNRTVMGNILFALRTRHRRVRHERATELLAMVGLHREGDRYPHELSGGQQQRVALARALAADPQLILLDEPFSNLDAALRDSTRRDVRNLLKCAEVSAILVTHDQEEALSFCDRVGVMHAGTIEQLDTPESIYLQPSTSFVAQFLGRANLLRAAAQGATAQTELGTIPIVPAAHGSVLVSLRPEHIALTRELNGGPTAEILTREFRGHDLTYRIRLNRSEFLVHTEYTAVFEPGERVELSARRPAVVLRETGLCGHAVVPAAG